LSPNSCLRASVAVADDLGHFQGAKYLFRKDDKSFAAIFIRRKKKKGKCHPSFLNGN